MCIDQINQIANEGKPKDNTFKIPNEIISVLDKEEKLFIESINPLIESFSHGIDKDETRHKAFNTLTFNINRGTIKGSFTITK